DIPIAADQAVRYIAWKGEPQALRVSVNQDTYEATLLFGGKETKATLTEPIVTPNILWRLTHPIEMLGLKRAQ
ncbi:MAG TPA: hypothetical protein VFT87_05330, partial [Candidatus Saccharimonadales bacterium]|nr:hypothetical protein [Candidatus Saccharimonadales bacterium]